MEYIDYYKILGIPKTASDAEIKKAYRKQARKYHPDLNPKDKTAEKKFKQINEANEVLSHPENRKKYDKYGKDWQHSEEFEKARKQQRRTHRTTGPDPFAEASGHDYSDFFESMFREYSGQRRQVKFKGQDFNAELHLDLRDVYKTHKRTLTVNGKDIRITIPAGIKNGQVIKIKGFGGPGINNGPKGDLYIKFILTNSTSFKRIGDDLYATVDLDLITAVLGGEITTNTFNGKVKLKVKPGTQNGAKVKLAGKGFPIYRKEDKFGELILTYRVKIPTQLNEQEKQLFSQLAKLRQS